MNFCATVMSRPNVMCKHPGCTQILASLQSMEEHYLVKHTPPEEGLIHCPNEECNFSHKLQRKVKQHHQNVHQNLKPHNCTHCPKSFSSTEKLRVHGEAVHEKQVRFACTKCAYKTYYKQQYVKHMRDAHVPNQVLRGEQHANTVLVSNTSGPDTTRSNGPQRAVVDKFVDAFPALHEEFRIDCLPGAVRPYVRVDAAIVRTDETVVLLDVDEKQHRDVSKYSVAAECDRMTQTVSALQACGVKSVMWVRLNPDTYTVNGMRTDSALHERADATIQEIRTFLDDSSRPPFRVAYVGFDMTDGRPVVTSHPDYAPELVSTAVALRCPSDIEAEQKAATVHRNKRATLFDKPTEERATLFDKPTEEEPDAKKTCLDHLKCSGCDRSFSDSSHLLRHIREQHEGKARVTKKHFPCTYEACTSVYTEPHNLKRHIEAEHLGIRYTCDLCGSQSTSKNNLFTHKKNKHGVGLKKLFKCPFADCTFATPYSNHVLAAHMRRFHQEGGASAEAEVDE